MWKYCETKVLKKFICYTINLIFLAMGSFLAGVAIDLIFIPNHLIDGGITGIAMILGKISSQELIPFFIIALNLPFAYLAFKYLGKKFLIHLIVAITIFSTAMILLEDIPCLQVQDTLEVIIIGGLIMGIGIGLIIRAGACLDGTEILAIFINKKTGYTVGQIIFFINIFIFVLAGFVFKSWRPPFLSLMTYFIAMKVMDIVIVGLEETKSINIISVNTKNIANALINEMGLGLTILYGRGGYSNENREIIYVVIERLQLAKLKEIVYREDPQAFIAIQNLHEISSHQYTASRNKTKAQ